MKAGKVYLEIAHKTLSGQMPEEQVQKLLQGGNFQEIDAYAGVKEYIEAGCCTIRRILESSDVFLPLEFADYVLWSDTPEEDLKSSIVVIDAHRFSAECKGEIAYRALTSVHDTWVKRNEERFFDPQFADERILFLRSEMIGYETLAGEYRHYVEPILRLIRVMPHLDWYIKDQYQIAKRQMMVVYGIRGIDDLQHLIRRGDYQPLTAMIANAMYDEALSLSLAEQAMERMLAK
ncbi:hypothetical protein IJI00_00540 [Candidatus Saccharibacteria bacterium]|nr:hypothetical protein [Candidatus Saccharibacteria bacterium]